MAVFSMEDDRIDDAGRRLAEHPRISHCYRRPPLPDFDYNLFAMVHGQSADEVCAIVADLAKDIGLDDYEVLFSTTEYKKTSMKYFVEPQGS